MDTIKILHIEDDRVDQAAFERMVREGNFPYQYDTAGSVAEAKDRLCSNRYDIVLLDHNLGDGTAFDILKLNINAPVIIVTGSGSEEIAAQAMKAGAFDYVIKDPAGKYLGLLPLIVEKAHRYWKAEKALVETTAAAEEWDKEIDQRSREMSVLGEMGSTLQACFTVDKAYTVIGRFVHQLFPFASGALYLLNAERTQAHAVARWGDRPPGEEEIAHDDCVALQRGRIHAVETKRAVLTCRHLGPEPPAGYLCVPMMVQGEIMGSIHLRSDMHTPNTPFIRQHYLKVSNQGLIVALSEHIALALSNRMLRVEATHDPLTGLYNRRYIEEAFERELNRADRRPTRLGVIMLDIDNFKKFNDEFGHCAGDVVLQEIGAYLQAAVRMGDIACRYGGEEFMLLLYDATMENSLMRAEVIRNGIKKLSPKYNGTQLGEVTVSAGVSAFPEHGSLSGELIRSADVAMYRAKEEGRDRVAAAC